MPTEVLTAMITPAVLISAAALLLLSTANRLGRVHDRLRFLFEQVQRPQASSAEPQIGISIDDQLGCLSKRVVLLRSAVTGIYVTIAFLIVTSIAAGMGVAFPRAFRMFPTPFGLLGAGAFLYSIVILVREAAIADKATLAEIAQLRLVLAKRR